MGMDTLTSIKVFRQVVESGSFVAAAERLDVSNAMVSKHVMHVERRLGVRLLNRNSHTLSLTEPGRVYFERCKAILEDLEATEEELQSLGSAPRGTLRIASPGWASGQRFGDLLAEYRRNYPEVVLDVTFEDRLVDLVEEGYDVALCIAQSPDSLPAGLIARTVRPNKYYLAASCEYVQRHGHLNSVEDLAQHDFVAVGNLNSLPIASATGTVEIPLRVVLRFHSLGGVANAVAAGAGIALLPGIIFEDPAFKDVLTPLLPELPLQQATMYIVYLSRKYVPLKIRTFIDFMVESLSISSLPEPKVIARC
jgi:DNA-binding transcriptional LysR family regulator